MGRQKRKKKGGDFRLDLPQLDLDDGVKKDIFGIFLFAVGAISALSFLSLAGTLGADIYKFIRILFGYGFVFFPIVLFVWGWRVIKSESLFKSQSYFVGIFMMVVSILTFLHLPYELTQMFSVARAGDGGGFVGAAVAWILVSLLGKWGGAVLALALLFTAFIFTFQISLIEIWNYIKPPAIIQNSENGKKKEKQKEEGQDEEKPDMIKALKEKIGGRKKEQSSEDETGNGEVAPVFAMKAMSDQQVKPAAAEAEPVEIKKEEPASKAEEEVAVNHFIARKSNWKLPPVSLLNGSDSEPTSGDIQANSNIIKRTLANFGIEVEMGEVNVGPTVTQYTLKPSVGVKLSRITALQNDLALALAAKTIRIEAPIPGKSWVGIELPNQTVAMVTLKNVLESPEFKNRKSNLSMILGRDVAGSSVIANVAKMPHLMIAGSTGSGKTVCVNTLITGLLFQNSPEELRFIMVDPKRVELTPYNDIPHLLAPVITDPDKAINALKWAVKEMENRYDLLSKFGCRNIESYNDAVRSGRLKEQDPLHYIIIVIDEMADLMATHGREMEAVVVRLAQMARAIGIHLVLSTQRPSVEVITGLIKANITTRIAFCVASQIDSRTILDSSGAEKLLGNGDMLYLSSDANKPKRIQGVFISEEEVRKVVDFIKEQKEEEPEYDSEIVESKRFGSDPMGEVSDVDDDLYNEALEVVRSAGKASASLLQRRLRVGYARAARLLDLMEDQGAIGPAQGAKPREVYVEGAVSGEGEFADEADLDQ